MFLDFVENIDIKKALDVLSYEVFKLTWGMYDINCHIFMPFYIATLPGEKVQCKIYLQCVNYTNPIDI